MVKKPLICIVGPTASGKTSLSLSMAEEFDGEIVSADSMQIYKGMDIGTAKPDMEERRGIPHHMMDIADIHDTYSVARYVKEASAVIDDINNRGKIPIVVGGTGLYIDNLLKGMDFAPTCANEEYRRELEAIADNSTLWKMLQAVDPGQADRLHINDRKRIIRALEVFHVSGEKISAHNEKTKKYSEKYNACVIGIAYKDRQLLYDRIDRRVEQMIESGIVDELRALVNSGVERTVTAFQAIGYKELIPYIEGQSTLDEAVEILKRATRRYAKRQLTWFRRNDDIKWFFADEMENFSELLQASTDFVRSTGIIINKNKFI